MLEYETETEFASGPAIHADVAALAKAAPADVAPPIEQFYNPHPDPRTVASANGVFGWAQTLTATSSFTLTTVQLPLGRGGSGNFTLQVLGTTGSGAPDPGDVLGTVTVWIPAIGPYQLFDFDFPAGIPLTSGDRYALFGRGTGWWAGQLPGGAPAVQLYSNPGNWTPFDQPADLYFLLFDGD